MLDNDYLGSIDLTWEDFEESIKAIAKKITEDFPNYKSIGILGMARGGLIILGEISYLLDTKNVGVMQMTFKDIHGVYRKDNGPRYLGEFLKDDIDEYIVVEDILVTGKTIKAAYDRLESMGKKLVGCYSMFTVGDFDNQELDSKNLIRWSYKKSDRRYWINFPWDKRIIIEKNHAF
ncbi:MAG: phosphoribosyltransferase [Clostridia bacterium]|nr:phosphoribosyltransferase [Clostridia bacterium]